MIANDIPTPLVTALGVVASAVAVSACKEWFDDRRAEKAAHRDAKRAERDRLRALEAENASLKQQVFTEQLKRIEAEQKQTHAMATLNRREYRR